MENHIIIGARITNKIQEHLDKCLPAHQFYFKDNDPDFLQIVRVEGQQVIGKKVDPGIPVTSIKDHADNVMSILKKICPERKNYFSAVRNSIRRLRKY